jgi:hypothetical protein
MGTLITTDPTADRLAELTNRLRATLRNRVRDLRLTIRDDRLFLHGRADSHYTKQLLLRDVMAAVELPIHANNLLVD